MLSHFLLRAFGPLWQASFRSEAEIFFLSSFYKALNFFSHMMLFTNVLTWQPFKLMYYHLFLCRN